MNILSKSAFLFLWGFKMEMKINSMVLDICLFHFRKVLEKIWKYCKRILYEPCRNREGIFCLCELVVYVNWSFMVISAYICSILMLLVSFFHSISVVGKKETCKKTSCITRSIIKMIKFRQYNKD